MSGDASLSRNQERFLQALSTGQSIVAAAKSVGISEQTAHRWLKDPLLQDERKRRETALAEKEQAEIERILTSGYAAIHNRVQALDQMAHAIEESLVDPNTKKINPKWLYPDKLREWRGCLDDIAKELGQRIKVSKADVTSAGEQLTAPNTFIYLPKVDEDEEEEGIVDGDNP